MKTRSSLFTLLLLTGGACAPSPEAARSAAAEDAGRPVDAGTDPGDGLDAGPPRCFPGASAVDLPERVLFRTAKSSFNRRWYVALHEGHLWVKPNHEQGQAPGEWRLLGSGLPAGSGLVRFPAPDQLVELSADGVHLQALSSAGVFYRGTDLTTDVHASFTWTDKWGSPGGDGPGMQRDFDTARGWSVSDSHIFGVAEYQDRNGTTQSIGLGVAHLYRLSPDGRVLFFNDWWLPNDWSHRACLPERGTLAAENLSTSASTTFVIGPRGELYTRLYDLDTGGENDLLTYSYLVSGPAGTTRALPLPDWRRQPDITDGLITRKITIFQDGRGNAARVLRVEGVRAAETGYYEKRIDDGAWTFHATGLEVCGPFLNAPERPAPAPVAPADLGLTRAVPEGPGDPFVEALLRQRHALMAGRALRPRAVEDRGVHLGGDRQGLGPARRHHVILGRFHDGVCRGTVYALVDRGQLERVWVGESIRILGASLRALIERGDVEPRGRGSARREWCRVMRVRILRQAMLEASAASDWYAARDPTLAEDFRIALDETVEQVAALPGVGSAWPGERGVRRAHLRGFPYWVVYEEGAEAITILAVAHEKRKPNYWREP